MSTLMIEELDTIILEQEFTTSEFVEDWGAVRPSLYKHNNPAGSLKMQVLDLQDQLVEESETITIQSITDASDAFFSGHVRFLMNISMLPNTTLKLRLVSIGYAFAEAAYIGWNKDFDLRKLEVTYSPSAGFQSAFLWEPWALQRSEKGILNG